MKSKVLKFQTCIQETLYIDRRKEFRKRKTQKFLCSSKDIYD